MSIKHTTAVSNGKLSTSKMAIGDSFVGEITDLKDGKFGHILVMISGGKEVTVFPSGNLKFLAKEILDGKKELNKMTTITRIADVMIKGYAATQFSISQGEEAPQAAAPAQEESVAAKLAAIRAKKHASV